MSRDKLVPVGQEKKPSCMLFCSYHQYCSASFVCAWVGEAVLNNILGGAFGLTYLCQNATYVCIFFSSLYTLIWFLKKWVLCYLKKII